MSHIFLLAGAPAVGKSSTAHALAKHFQKSIHISVDHIRDMVVSGLRHPGKEWDQELIEQLVLARETACHMALIYNKAGFTVAIDDFWDPNNKLQEYNFLFQEKIFHKILLIPSQIEAEERNIKRSGIGEENKYIAEGIRIVYKHLQEDLPTLKNQGWIIVDTTHKTIEATVKHILLQVK